MIFSKLSEELKDFATDVRCQKSVVIGGDFNVILDPDLDGRGRNKKRKDSVRYVEDMIIEHDLVDIWHIRNPTDTRFTWRQKPLLIQRRLHYWLISNDVRKDVESVEIITAIKSDHSANGDKVFGNLTLLLLMTKSNVTFSARNIKTG